MQLNQLNHQSSNFPIFNASFFSPQFSAECVEDVAIFDPEPSSLAFLQGDPSIKKADIFESLALNCIAAAWRRILPNLAMEVTY
jgi:hypothetical protein